MDATARIEQALDLALARAETPGCPPGLAAAVRYAVFPGGARLRPRLCLAVAWACGEGIGALGAPALHAATAGAPYLMLAGLCGATLLWIRTRGALPTDSTQELDLDSLAGLDPSRRGRDEGEAVGAEQRGKDV